MHYPLLIIEQAMERCITLGESAIAHGNYGLGAAVIDADGSIVAEQSSTLIHSSDPSAHPEMLAIREAAAIRQSRYLPDLMLVTTLEPCVMCTGASLWARMGGIAFGATQEMQLHSVPHSDPEKYHTWRQLRLRVRK